MKCDELKAETIVPHGSAITLQMYGKAEVDKAIAELKDKVQQKDFFWEGCAFAKRGFKNTIEVSEYVETMENLNDELRKENESLKYSVAAIETDLAMSQRWRKCSEELPEEYTDVLFVDSDGTYYLGDMWIISTDGVNPAEQYWSGRGEPRCNNPKYWLPLPKAPEADK